MATICCCKTILAEEQMDPMNKFRLIIRRQFLAIWKRRQPAEGCGTAFRRILEWNDWIFFEDEAWQPSALNCSGWSARMGVGAEMKNLWCSSLCAIGRNEVLFYKDEHLCYGVQMMNVEARNRMDMDHFSPLSRGEQLPIPGLLFCSCKEFPRTSVKQEDISQGVASKST